MVQPNLCLGPIVLLAALAACTALPPETTPALGPPINESLKQGYLGLAAAEPALSGRRDAYRAKAADATFGEPVGPTRLGGRALPADAGTEAAVVRERLVAARRRSADTRNPDLVATAQTSFDCWIDALASAPAGAKASACRERTLAALNQIDAALPPGAVVGYTVYFPNGSARLGQDAEPSIGAAVEAARVSGRGLTVVGHTDRTGSEAANATLAQRRTAAVAQALRDAGVTAPIATRAAGEAQPAIATADDVVEPSNRRVEILLGG